MKLVNWNTIDHRMPPNHSGSPRLRVMLRCLDLVNTYGNRPRKLTNKVNVNKEQNRVKVPGSALGPKSALSSEFMYISVFLSKSWD